MESIRKILRINLLTICLIVTAGPLAHAQTEAELRSLNRITLKGDIDLILPAEPSAPEDRAQFESLTPEEKIAFYQKRAIIIEKHLAGLTKPGLGSAIRWTKGAIKGSIDFGRRMIFRSNKASGRSASMAEVAVGDITGEVMGPQTKLELEYVPADFSPAAKQLVESTVTTLVKNLWENSAEISRAKGYGATIVLGAIWNTTLGPLGWINGRGLSVDFGYNFQSGEGYAVYYHDRQYKLLGGLSFDIGPMVDFLFSMTDPNVKVGDVVTAKHLKLPAIGCFRSGPSYKAWGLQFGYHVIEMVGTVLSFVGHPGLGLSLITGMRIVGGFTVYQTGLDRTVIKVSRISADSKLLKRFGIGPRSARMSRCELLFTAAP